VAAGGEGLGPPRVWDLRAGPACQREFGHRGAAVNAAALHANGAELVSGDQAGAIRVWDLGAGTCSCELVPAVR
jgi:G protein beta subunit-like protein